MEELSIYNLTITSDHKLKVNNAELDGDGSILPGDSEGLLTWALMQVGYIQQDSDSSMALHIEDQRSGGYGVQRVTIPPGQQVLIEDLRRQTGRDLSHITREVEQEHHGAQDAADGVTEPDEGYTPEDDPTASFADTGSWGDSPETSWDAPAAPGAGAPAAPPAGASLAAEPAGGSTVLVAEESPAPQPAPEDKTEVEPESELNEAASPEPVTEPEDFVAVEEDIEDETAAPAPAAAPEQSTVADTEEPTEHATTDDEVEPANTKGSESLVTAFGSKGSVIEREEIKSKRRTYKRNRPELGEDEAKKVKGKKPKMPKAKTLLVALVVMSLVAVGLLFLLLGAQEKSSYVATCIDERTMTRQSSEAGCESDSAPYYRWWYTPKGSEVPAVNQNVAQDQGTRVRPEEASIKEGFDPMGGPYDG